MMAKEIQGNLFTVCRIEVDKIPATLGSHLGRADTCTLGRVKRSLQGLADGFPSMMVFASVCQEMIGVLSLTFFSKFGAHQCWYAYGFCASLTVIRSRLFCRF